MVLKKKRFEKFFTYFYGSNPEHPEARLFWTLRPSFKQNRYETTRQCIEVKASEASGSEQEDFFILFYASNQGAPGAEPFCTLRPICENKNW